MGLYCGWDGDAGIFGLNDDGDVMMIEMVPYARKTMINIVKTHLVRTINLVQNIFMAYYCSSLILLQEYIYVV